MKIRLMKENVLELPLGPKGARKEYLDTDLQNFGLRVSGSVRKYFVLKRVAGKRVRVTFGGTDTLTPTEARKKARVLLGQMEGGADPNEKKKTSQAKEPTFKKVFRDYLDNRKLKPKTHRTYESLFDAHLSDWWELPIDQITKTMIRDRHREISKTNPVPADNVMRTLRAVINYVMDDEAITDNPVSTLTRKKEWNGARRKRRVVTAVDLPKWYNAVNELQNPTYRDYFLFLLFAGLRAESEAQVMKWEDINLKERWFVAPDTKNKEPLYLPLPDILHVMLTQRSKVYRGEYVFPGQKSPHITNTKHAAKEITNLTGIKWSPHDLRRTFITIAESLDLSTYTLKALVNHKQDKQDVTAGYVIFTVDRLREPMQRVADLIMEIIEGK